MKDFELILPERVIFGRGNINKVADEVEVFGKRALIIHGRSSAKQIVEKLGLELKSKGIEVFSYSGIIPEPTLSILDKVRYFAKEKQVDFVIGVGGGSVLDVAKATAGLYYETADSAEYQAKRRIKTKGIPFIAIPTISGSGAEATYNAVIINEKENTKKSIRHKNFMAKLVIIDPTLSLTVNERQMAISGIDALVHGIEAFTSCNSNMITDTLALLSIKLISSNIKKAVDNPGSLSVKENIAMASFLGGVALANAGLGAIHGLASPIGALYRLPHGLVCGVLTPYIMEYNLEACMNKYADIAKALRGEYNRSEEAQSLAFSAITAIDELLKNLKLPTSLADLGIKEEDIGFIVKNVSDSIKNNPKKINILELDNLLRQALRRK